MSKIRASLRLEAWSSISPGLPFWHVRHKVAPAVHGAKDKVAQGATKHPQDASTRVTLHAPPAGYKCGEGRQKNERETKKKYRRGIVGRCDWGTPRYCTNSEPKQHSSSYRGRATAGLVQDGIAGRLSTARMRLDSLASEGAIGQMRRCLQCFRVVRTVGRCGGVPA